MSRINEEVERLHQQFHIRASGENGVAKGLIDMSNPMEFWWVIARVNFLFFDLFPLHDSAFLVFPLVL